MAVESNLSGENAGAGLLKYILNCKTEAKDAKYDRMQINKDNYAMYQLEHDFSHKKAGQSQEVLPKQRMAVEQIKSFFQQALADLGEWFRVSIRNNIDPEEVLPVKPHEMQKLLAYMHEKSRYFSHVGNAIQSGLLGALIITKTVGKMCSAPRYVKETEGKGKNYRKKVVKIEDKTWQLVNQIVRQEDYYPDPTGNDLYEIETLTMDLYEVVAKSKGDAAIYDASAVSELSTTLNEDWEREWEKSKETGQDTTFQGFRPKVRIMEFWGDVVNEDGTLEHENVVITVANETHIIRKPTPNPLWHQRSPYTRSPLLEVANSVWPIALMDAPTRINRTIIELHNLLLDASFKKVHAISQIRVNDLVDPSQISDGIPSGTKLLVKSSLPHGAKVMEAVEEADVPKDAISMLNIHQQEFNAAALTNDLRQGVMPFRAVKATEVVEASQTITSVFQGLAKNVESRLIEPELELHAYTIAQNWNNISKEVFVSLFGVERGTELSQVEPEDVFVAIVNGCKFDVFGVTQTLSKQQDFRKLTTLLQTIGGSDVLIEEFIKKYDFGKLLGEIMMSLDIDKNKIELPEADIVAPVQQPGAGGDSTGTAQNLPQAGAASVDPMMEAFGQSAPQPGFGGEQ